MCRYVVCASKIPTPNSLFARFLFLQSFSRFYTLKASSSDFPWQMRNNIRETIKPAAAARKQQNRRKFRERGLDGKEEETIVRGICLAARDRKVRNGARSEGSRARGNKKPPQNRCRRSLSGTERECGGTQNAKRCAACWYPLRLPIRIVVSMVVRDDNCRRAIGRKTYFTGSTDSPYFLRGFYIQRLTITRQIYYARCAVFSSRVSKIAVVE